MATNNYNNAVHITKAALAVIEGDGTLIKNVRRDDKEFAQDGTAQADALPLRFDPDAVGVLPQGPAAQL